MRSLEDNVLKPRVSALKIRKTHEENEKGKEVQIPFQAADETKSTIVIQSIFNS